MLLPPPLSAPLSARVWGGVKGLRLHVQLTSEWNRGGCLAQLAERLPTKPKAWGLVLTDQTREISGTEQQLPLKMRSAVHTTQSHGDTSIAA